MDKAAVKRNNSQEDETSGEAVKHPRQGARADATKR